MSKTVQLQYLSAVNEQALAIYRQSLDESRDARKYLSDRGLRRPDAERFEMGYAPLGNPILNAVEYGYMNRDDAEAAGLIVQNENKTWRDKFNDRVMFPIRDEGGILIGFGGRVINKRPNDQRPKYINTAETPLFKKGENLFGLNQAIISGALNRQVVVVEGYMDVVMLSHYGIDNAVAALGTSITNKQIQKLTEKSESIVFCFDGDDAGYRAAQRALKLTSPLVTHSDHIRFGFLPDGDDPDSYIQKVGAETFRLAVDSQSMTFDGFMFANAIIENPGDDTDTATLARRYSHASAGIRKMFDSPVSCGDDDRYRNLYRVQCLSSLNTMFEFEPDYVPDILSLQVHPHYVMRERPVNDVKSTGDPSRINPKSGRDHVKNGFQWSNSIRGQAMRRDRNLPVPQIDIAQKVDDVAIISAVVSAYPESLAMALDHLGLSELPFKIEENPCVLCDAQSNDDASSLLVALIEKKIATKEMVTRKELTINQLESMPT